MAEADGRVTMVPLEEDLFQDEKGELIAQLEKELGEHIVEGEQRLRTGLQPADYQREEKLLAALEAAKVVVRKYWTAYHGSRDGGGARLRKALVHMRKRKEGA